MTRVLDDGRLKGRGCLCGVDGRDRSGDHGRVGDEGRDRDNGHGRDVLSRVG